MGDIIWWVLFGLIAGAIAKWIRPGDQSSPWYITAALGIVGAIVGGWIGSFLFHRDVGNGFNLYNFGLAVVGSLIVLAIYSALSRRR